MQKFDTKTFQGLILTLQDYWARQGCTIVQPLDMEVGAGTSHPMTSLRALGPEPMDRWPLRRKPEPFAALLSVPGGD